MKTTRLLKPVLYDDSGQYWIGQLIFWFGLSVIPFLGMVLWYERAEWIYIQHMFLQAAMGLVLSQVLAYCYLAIWPFNALVRLVLALLLAGLTALAWTALRIVTYIWLTDEEGTWAEFGGWYFGAFYIYLCWSALYHGLNYYLLLQVEHAAHLEDIERARHEQIRRLKAEAIAREAQLKMLRYQINPHFLFNTLHSIYALVRLKEEKKSLAMIDRLGKFLRYSLEYDPNVKTTLDDELKTLSLYIDIERIRFSDRLTLNIHVDETAGRAQVPSLLLQPLIENAVKYAVAGTEQGAKIAISARIAEQRWLVISVADNGPGFGKARSHSVPSHGVGLRNISERLETLFGENYQFQLLDVEPHGLNVEIQIPYSI
ncbi:sensor histidine kinase [Gilvimarinus agarilyticus]|uniref:sensor histidine kinase n=1 Tax=Gilvimarinus agarilyticus TaxID=679259 RepID=UPI00059EE915|nr:histidine kinase [Gilvimarinus agarilyticus]